MRPLFLAERPANTKDKLMAWYYRLLFVAAAAWAAWGFARKEVYYPFSSASPETRMPMWLARTVTGLLAAFFIWLAFLK